MYKNQELLREHNLKATPQRLAIVELMQIHGHISIEELYKYVKEKFASISLATLYKNINAMIAVDFVKEIKIPYTKTKYELIKDPHSHLLCEKCNKVEDITIDLKAISQDCANNSHYQVNEASLLLSGICPSCQ